MVVFVPKTGFSLMKYGGLGYRWIQFTGTGLSSPFLNFGQFLRRSKQLSATVSGHLCECGKGLGLHFIITTSVSQSVLNSSTLLFSCLFKSTANSFVLIKPLYRETSGASPKSSNHL